MSTCANATLPDGEVHAVLVEPARGVNTGNAGGSMIAGYDDSWRSSDE
jgi:hypothetical protein